MSRIVNHIARALLLAGIVAVVAGAVPVRAEMIVADPQGLKFGPVPGLPACAASAPLRGDPAKGAAVLLAKLASGCRIPWHWHTASEEVLVVSGKGRIEMKDGTPLEFKPGAYASMPGHHIHQATCSSTCMLFIITDGAFDIHYVNDSGAEIPAEEALKATAPDKKEKQ